MREFDTPGIISVVVEVHLSHIRIVAAERATTVVDVRPQNPDRPLDVEIVEQTRVDFCAGLLRVRMPRPPSQEQAASRTHGAIEVVIEVPNGSQIQADTEIGAIHTRGILGDCRLTSALGDIHVDTAHALELTAEAGAVSVRQAGGRAEIRVSQGATTIDTITGELLVESAHGDITVGAARADVTARTAVGSIRVGEAVRGAISVETSMGNLEVGIHPGTAAQFDVHTEFGSVRNEFDAAERAVTSDDRVQVRARASVGDIVVRRAA
ncbi:DUF4097 family beta strand repeat-containing protein [Nocardia vaccinii]|uniref:DUF4097 family beta strand repeat-containing protein n=1 Tax=Nocardia vaccinii TaxID=1822 RepID=UPI00082E70F3|nr:DUF4097 family beta strand repeat-containing protein [Nocardia vaccinii]